MGLSSVLKVATRTGVYVRIPPGETGKQGTSKTIADRKKEGRREDGRRSGDSLTMIRHIHTPRTARVRRGFSSSGLTCQ